MLHEAEKLQFSTFKEAAWIASPIFRIRSVQPSNIDNKNGKQDLADSKKYFDKMGLAIQAAS